MTEAAFGPALRAEGPGVMTATVSDPARACQPGQDESQQCAIERVPRSSWRLMGEQDFRRYFLGSLGSNIGTWLQNTAQVLLAYQITHSVFTVGLVVSAQFAGVLLLSPWAAVLADRLGATLVGTQWVSAVIAFGMACLYARHVLSVHLLIIGALGLGLAFSLALPLQTALVPSLVCGDDTEAAMAMNSVSYNSGRALAPALCVLVIAFVGPGWIFVINAVSFAIFAIVLSRLKPDVSDDGLLRPAGETDMSRRIRVMDGVRTARQQRRLLLLLAIVAAVTLADDPILVLSPGLVRTTLGVSNQWAGSFIAALGWGTILGSLLPITRQKAIAPRRASRRAAVSLLCLAISVVVFALGISALVSLAAALAAGVTGLITGATVQNLIVGRNRHVAASVAGLWAVAWAGTKPIASLLDGGLAKHFGFLAAAIVLTFPAALLALGELMLPGGVKEIIKKWALHLEPCAENGRAQDTGVVTVTTG